MNVRFGPITSYILFGGTAVLARCASILKKRRARVHVVTSPRQASERIPQQTLAETLATDGIPFEISTDAPHDEALLRRIDDRTIGISIGSPWIFKKDFIDRFGGRLVNCHGTRLPRNRGGGAFSWMIMSGERKGSALIHMLAPGLDTGEILMKKDYLFPAHSTPQQRFDVSVAKYGKLFERLFDRLERRQDFKTIQQDERTATYWPRLSTDVHGFVDWNWNADEIARFVRAFDEPYPGASTFVGDKRVRLFGASLAKGDGNPHPFQAGLIYRIHGGRTFVAARGGGIAFGRVEVEGGGAITLGERLHTPLQKLEEAKTLRAVYTSSGLKKRA
jgi:methionyl-tRNA formyltransferase